MASAGGGDDDEAESKTSSRHASRDARRLHVGVAEMMGRRLRMEDACVVQRHFRGRVDEALLAVFDAHSGSDVAEQAASASGGFASELAALLGGADVPLPADADDVAAAMAAAYWNVNERCKKLGVLGGAVAVAVLIHLDSRGGGHVYCSNVGDARAVLCLGQPGTNGTAGGGGAAGNNAEERTPASV